MARTYLFTREAYKELRAIIVARKEAIEKGVNYIKVMHPLRHSTVNFLSGMVSVTAHGAVMIKTYGKHYTIRW